MEAHIHAAESPLRLNKYFLKRLFFTLHEGFDRGKRPVKDVEVPRIGIGVLSADQNPDNPLQWRFEVHLELEEPKERNFPYKVEATLVGYFTVSEKYNRERAERLAKVNGPALLYSSARDLIMSITNRSPYPAIQIPSMMFIPLEETAEDPKQLPAPRKRSSKKSAQKQASKSRKKTAKK